MEAGKGSVFDTSTHRLGYKKEISFAYILLFLFSAVFIIRFTVKHFLFQFTTTQTRRSRCKKKEPAYRWENQFSRIWFPFRYCVSSSPLHNFTSIENRFSAVPAMCCNMSASPIHLACVFFFSVPILRFSIENPSYLSTWLHFDTVIYLIACVRVMNVSILFFSVAIDAKR